MAKQPISITCIKCGHTWDVNLDELVPDQLIFRSPERGRTEQYRVQCPKDSTFNVITVEIKERS